VTTTTAHELTAAGPAADEAAAAALAAAGDDDDLRRGPGDDDDEGDEGDGPDDPAEQAALWREDAAGLRAERARVLAEAQVRIDAVAAEASAEADRLEAEALAADKAAGLWQADADLAARIVDAEAEIISLTAARGALAAEEARLQAEADQLSARLAEFAAARAEADQRMRRAPDINDVDGSIEAMKAALADLRAIELAEQPAVQRRAAAEFRLAEIRGPADGMREIRAPGGALVRGPAGEVPVTEDALSRAHLRLTDLRRERQHLPPLADRQELLVAYMLAVLGKLAACDGPGLDEELTALVPREALDEVRAVAGGQGGRAPTARDVAQLLVIGCVPRFAEWLDRVAAEQPEVYQAMRRVFVEGSAPAPEAAPSMREVLSQPGMTLLGDGSLRYEPPFEGWGRGASYPGPGPADLRPGGW